jgi:hypothetical protein
MADVLAIADHPRAFLHAERLAFLVAGNLVKLTGWAIRHDLLTPAAIPSGFTEKPRMPTAILWENKGLRLAEHLQAHREARVTWPLTNLHGWKAATEILRLAQYPGLHRISKKPWPYDLLDLLKDAGAFWNENGSKIHIPGHLSKKHFLLKRLPNPFAPLHELTNTYRHGFVEVVPSVTDTPPLLVTVGFQLL